MDYGALVRKDGALARKDSVLSGLQCTCQIQHIFDAAIPAAHMIGSLAGHITPCFQITFVVFVAFVLMRSI